MSMPREINGNQLVGTQNEAVPTRLIFNAALHTVNNADIRAATWTKSSTLATKC